MREKSVVPYSSSGLGTFASVWDFAFSPDDSQLALVGDNRIDIVSLPGGSTTQSFRIDAGGTALAWNPQQAGVLPDSSSNGPVPRTTAMNAAGLKPDVLPPPVSENGE